MQIQERKLETIRPYPNNPRRNDEAVQAVAASLREFGWRQPIVVDRDGVIIVGHTRYKAAQELGLAAMMVGQYVLKFILAALDTPIFYLLTRKRDQ